MCERLHLLSMFELINSRIPACSVSTELIELVAYFDATYVSGPVRSILWSRRDLCVHPCRSAPMFPHLFGMFTKKRLRTATGLTTCPKTGTKHSLFSSGTVIRLCWSRWRPFSQTWRCLNSWLSWMLADNHIYLQHNGTDSYILEVRVRLLIIVLLVWPVRSVNCSKQSSVML